LNNFKLYSLLYFEKDIQPVQENPVTCPWRN